MFLAVVLHSKGSLVVKGGVGFPLFGQFSHVQMVLVRRKVFFLG